MTVLRALARQVNLRPEAPALIYDGRLALTYGALWARAGAVAAGLRDRGIGPGDRVALLGEKRPEQLIALLGAWRAGAAWVPVGPELPHARRRRVLEVAEVGVGLAWDKTEPLMPEGAVLRLDPREAEVPTPALAPNTPAYCIFTSGSTGRPKGVLVPHRGLRGVFEAQVEALGLGPEDRVLDALSPSFDARVSDLGVAWLAGAALVMEPEFALWDTDAVARVLKDRAVTYADLPPSLLPRLDPARVGPALQVILTGGEVCPAEVLRRWARRVRVFVAYGPTEASICASLARVDEVYPEAGIGRPLPGVRFALDPIEGRPEDVGELRIAGPGLALGYLGAPGLTEDRFVEQDGLRWYRTGDLASLREDGGYVFRGRRDRQVKLRGRLVEPAEVEARLRAHPEVEDAAVVVADGELFAHVQGEVSAKALRGWVAAALPAYMVPGRARTWPRLPRTATGKVDRARLAPEAAGPAPASLEGAVARILGVPDLGPDEDLYALGLESMGLLSLVEQAARLGAALDPADLGPPLSLRRLRSLDATGARPASRAELERHVARWRASPGPAAAAGAGAGRRVLVTGATGFVGRHLVPRLVAGGYDLVALVRGRDEPTARARLRRVVGPAAERVQVCVGDLEAPQYGLPDEAWAELGHTVDGIVHLGARVSLVEGYPALEASNVGAVARALALARLGRPKWLLHASSLAVFVATDRPDPVFFESDDLSRTDGVHGGYAQTKWVAERLVAEARDVPSTVARLGLITANLDTGAFNPSDHLCLFVRGLAQLQPAPDLPAGLALDMTPVEYAARALAALVDARAQGTFHVCGPAPVAGRALGEAVQRARPVASVPEDASGATAAAARLTLRRLRDPGDRARDFDLFSSTGHRYDRRRMQAVLPDSAAGISAVGAADLDRLVRLLLSERP